MSPKLLESELVILLIAGDKRALEYLYDNYSAALYGVLQKIVRDVDVAQDLLQDSYMKIWQNRTSYDSSKGSLYTWLLTITRRIGLDKFRSSDFQRSRENQISGGNVDSNELPGGQVFHPDHIDVVANLKALPNDQREIIDLMYFKGYTQAEIADEFGIPLGTIKTRARSALSTLRVVFKDYQDSAEKVKTTQ